MTAAATPSSRSGAGPSHSAVGDDGLDADLGDRFRCGVLPSPFDLAVAVTASGRAADRPVVEAFVFVIDRGRHFLGFERSRRDGRIDAETATAHRVLEKMIRAAARGRPPADASASRRSAEPPDPRSDLLVLLTLVAAFRPHLAWIATATASRTLRTRLDSLDGARPPSPPIPSPPLEGARPT